MGEDIYLELKMVRMMINLTLETVEWKEFKISELFSINRGNAKNITLKADNGKVALLSARDTNNAYNISVTPEKNETIYNNCITINNNGSVGFSFYHAYNFIASSDVTVLSPISNVSKESMQFLVVILNKLQEKYSYGYKISNNRIRKQIIMIPVDSHYKPNWEFMENYIKQEQKKQVKRLEVYYSKKLEQLTNEKLLLEDAEWKKHTIDELFNLKQGKSKGLNHLEKGFKTPYLGATNRNNGVLDFVENKNEYISQGNCIAFIRNGEGSMGFSVYKHENFIATSDITLGYNEKLDRYTGTFITTIADTVRGKYNFGYKRSLNRLKKESLLLPTNSNGEPHWQYMGNYMKSQEIKLITRILKLLYVSDEKKDNEK